MRYPTYEIPIIKTPITAIFEAMGIFRPKKIQKGRPRTKMSVNIVRHEIVIWNELSTQVALAIAAASQLAFIGRHCRSATRKIAMACRALKMKIPQIA